MQTNSLDTGVDRLQVMVSKIALLLLESLSDLISDNYGHINFIGLSSSPAVPFFLLLQGFFVPPVAE